MAEGDIYKRIRLKDEKVIMETDNNEIIEVCDEVRIKKTIKDIDSNGVKSLIKFKTFYGTSEEIIVSRGDYMNPNSLIKLQSYGMDIRIGNVKIIIFHLSNEERKAPIELIHSKLGFSKYEGKEIYKHYKAIGIESTYQGPYLIEPKGDSEQVKLLIKEEILIYTPSKFILLVSLASVTISYLSEVIDVNVILINLFGNSTTGKSTICKFAVSLFGYPGIKESGLFFTYNATDNAIMKRMEGIYGCPLAIDELSMSDSKKKNLVYKFHSGKNKYRLNQDSSQKENDGWLGSVFTNGEKSLIKSSSKNVGVQLRVIEVANVQWTKSAEHAEKINEVIMNNYGHIGPMFAGFIMSKDKEELKQKYEKSVKYLMKVFNKKSVKDNFTKRRVVNYAMIHLTGKLFSEMFETEIDLKDIVKMFIEIEKESIKNRNFEDSAFEYIKSYVTKHINKFETDSNKVRGEVWGYIIKKKDCIEVEINPLKFDEMLKEGGYEDKDVVLKEFKNNGILNCDKDRYTRKRKHGLGKIPMIVIKIKK